MVVPSHCLGVGRERTTENSKLPGSDRGTVIIELKSRVNPKVELKMSSYVLSIRGRFQDRFDETGRDTAFLELQGTVIIIIIIITIIISFIKRKNYRIKLFLCALQLRQLRKNTVT